MKILDTMSLILWSAVYIIILWNGIRSHGKMGLMIPLLACTFNLSWEVNAAVNSGGFWGHMAWFLLDVGVFLLNMNFVWRNAKRPAKYTVIYFTVTILSMQLFHDIFRHENGMLISSFVINFIMSVMFIVLGKQIEMTGKIPIAAAKMIGTLCASIVCGKISLFLAVLGTIIFLVDLFYLACCMEEQSRSRKKGAKLCK